MLYFVAPKSGSKTLPNKPLIMLIKTTNLIFVDIGIPNHYVVALDSTEFQWVVQRVSRLVTACFDVFCRVEHLNEDKMLPTIDFLNTPCKSCCKFL